MSITIRNLVTGFNNELQLNLAPSALSVILKNMLLRMSRKGRWRCLHKTAPVIALLAGAYSITKPSDFRTLDCITLNDGTYNKAPLKPLEGGFEQWKKNRENETSGDYSEPLYRTERGPVFFIDPIADKNYTVSFQYWGNHTTQNITDDNFVVLFEDAFEMALLYTLCAIYLDSKNRHQKAVYYWGMAQQEIDELGEDYEDKKDRTIQYSDL